MKTSPAGLNLIRLFEGCELTAYQDIAGVLTIGYGHTGPVFGAALTAKTQVTQAEADQLLLVDVARREDAVLRLARAPLNQNEFDALVSFVYNVGETAFANSTARRQLNEGDRAGAVEALTWFNNGVG